MGIPVYLFSHDHPTEWEWTWCSLGMGTGKQQAMRTENSLLVLQTSTQCCVVVRPANEVSNCEVDGNASDNKQRWEYKIDYCRPLVGSVYLLVQHLTQKTNMIPPRGPPGQLWSVTSTWSPRATVVSARDWLQAKLMLVASLSCEQTFLSMAKGDHPDRKHFQCRLNSHQSLYPSW